jgi:hypothetical protein
MLKAVKEKAAEKYILEFLAVAWGLNKDKNIKELNKFFRHYRNGKSILQ